MKKGEMIVEEIKDLEPAVVAEMIYTKYSEIRELAGGDASNARLTIHGFVGLGQLDESVWKTKTLKTNNSIVVYADREGITLFSKDTIK